MDPIPSLTNAQRVAATHPGHLALHACPGSGKTRTLIARLAFALDSATSAPRTVACITYTNAAVHEIRDRLSLLGLDGSQFEVETIHSFCLRHILGPHGWRLEAFKDGFTILPSDSPQFVELSRDIAKEFGLKARAIREFEQLARGTGALPDSISQPAAEAFWKRLDALQLVDFGGIVFWSRRLVVENTYISHGLACLFRDLLIDEFQDTSSLQVDILNAIIGHNLTRCFVVGDTHQSIMSFAGARPQLLAQFASQIGAKSDIALLDNYRSSGHIVALAEEILPRSSSPMSAVGPNRAFGTQPTWFRTPSMAVGLATHFISALKAHSIEFRNAAVLANRWTSLVPLARPLKEAGVSVIGPGARPYRKSNHIVAGLIEELAACASEPTPDNRHVRMELRRLLDALLFDGNFGFRGDVCAERLVRAARAAKSTELAEDFLLAITEQIVEVLYHAGLLQASGGAKLRESALALVADIKENGESQTLRVGDLGLFSRGSSSVRLLTMHGAKGREFDAVALVDVFDGHVPFYKTLGGDEIEAEGRRLLYVAVTRARKVLHIYTLLAPDKDTAPSRFLPPLTHLDKR